MRRRNFVLVVALLLHTGLLIAQSRNYNIYRISIENGLPTNDLQYVFQDSYGFLWVGSFEGVLRWDGYTFKKYQHNEKDSTSINHNIVYTIFEDSKKNLWVGTIDGLNLYSRETDSFIKCTIGQKGQRVPVNVIKEDSKQRLWLGTSMGLCQYDSEKKLSKWVLDTQEDLVFSMDIDNADNIWAGTFNAGVLKYSQITKTIQRFSPNKTSHRGLPSNSIKSIFCDDENNIWVGTMDKGLVVLDSEGNLREHYNNFNVQNSNLQNTINCIYQDKRKTIWVGVGRGPLHYISNGKATVVDHTILNSDPNQLSSVSSISEDSFGNIWFTTTGNGLFYTNVNKNVFENYLHNPFLVRGLKTSVITCFYEDMDGNLWIGTERSGFLKANLSKKTFEVFSTATHPLTNDAITDIHGDTAGNLWITTWSGGVMIFDPKTEKIKKFVHDPSDINSLPINDSKILLHDDNVVWVGTHGFGLVAYDKRNQKFIHQNNNTQFPFQMSAPGWINHLYKDSKGHLWISTYSGLFMFDGKTFAHFAHSSDTMSVSSNSVNMVTESKDGKIWIVSEAGLDEFVGQDKFIRHSEKHQLPGTMKAIVTDDKSRLWITSNEGLLSIDPSDFSVRRFDASDGLQGNSFFHKAAIRTKNGKLLLGGPHGFTVFHPDSLKPVSQLPTYFYTTDLYVYNEVQFAGKGGSPLSKVLSFTDQLTLTSEESFFSIEVASINLYSPGKTKYSYKLEGFHDEWINLGNDRKISFTNLDPGTYDLKVKYSNLRDEWHESDKVLRITILPPWWKTTVFKFLMFVLVASGVAGFFYLRTSTIKKRNRILKAEVEKRTQELSEANSFLVERSEEIKLQNERLEEFNDEILRQSEKILEQQKHITEQNHELEHTVEELQKLNKTKDHFFSILAHDLKNPISALTGISEFMKSNFMKMEKNQVHEYLSSIHKSSNAVYELLVNLLNWSRSQSKKIEYSPTSFQITEVIQKNKTLLEPQITNKHISLAVDVDDRHTVFADYNMIDTVIRNVISNSIKFTEYNGSIRIYSTETDDGVEIKISDNGVGMSQDQLNKLFSLDKNNISVGTAGEKGTGLGLVITQEFVAINRGEIKLQSAIGRGTDFHILIPKSTEPVKFNTKTSRALVRQEIAKPEFWEDFPIDKLLKVKGKKILIIDDNPELRSYLKLILSGTFEIFEAANGKDGLEMSLQVQPTLIVSDLLMPLMNGIEFCNAVKTNSAISHIPVILLTSQSESHAELSGYEAGADIYLTKPVKKELLIQVILNLIYSQEKLRRKIQESILSNSPTLDQDMPLNKVDEEFLKKLIDYIECNISDANIDSRAICAEIGMSRTVLYSKIKSLTGQSVHEFIKTIRLKRSVCLLLEGSMNISQIALEVGFNSHSYFHKCFLKQYGVGPKEYIANRKRSRQT